MTNFFGGGITSLSNTLSQPLSNQSVSLLGFRQSYRQSFRRSFSGRWFLGQALSRACPKSPAEGKLCRNLCRNLCRIGHFSTKLATKVRNRSLWDKLYLACRGVLLTRRQDRTEFYPAVGDVWTFGTSQTAKPHTLCRNLCRENVSFSRTRTAFICPRCWRMRSCTFTARFGVRSMRWMTNSTGLQTVS